LSVSIARSTFPHRAAAGRTSVSAITTTADAFFGVVLVVAVLVVHRPAPWLALLGRATHAVLPARLADRITRIADGLVAGLEVLTSPGRFVAAVFWSVVLWLVNAAAFAVCFRAFGLPVPGAGSVLLLVISGCG